MDSCSVFSCPEFKLVQGSVSLHLKALNHQGPHFSFQQYALVCTAFLVSGCLAVFLPCLAFPSFRFAWLNLVFRASKAQSQDWLLLTKH